MSFQLCERGSDACCSNKLIFEALSRGVTCEGQLGLTALRTASMCLPAGGSCALLPHSWVPARGHLPVAQTTASGPQVGGAALQVRLQMRLCLMFRRAATPSGLLIA